MEVCGTHTMAIARAGIKKLLPSHIQLISGPGCPVCVTDQADIDRAIEIARLKDVIFTTFGDMVRVPGTRGSLEELKSQGADIRMVYSCMDALEIARQNPAKKIVFMGVRNDINAVKENQSHRQAGNGLDNNRHALVVFFAHIQLFLLILVFILLPRLFPPHPPGDRGHPDGGRE